MVSFKLLRSTILLMHLFGSTTSFTFGGKFEVTIPQGKIIGLLDLLNKQIKFLGIPYASIEGRFEAPGKPPSWNGTFIADRGMIKCKQHQDTLKIAVGQEDCLVLNIFIPTSHTSKPLPVMVFIHGGGFYWGSNTKLIYNPVYLVKEGVIVVTINYRLGAFGFLCLGHKEAPGNAGLKDQIAALKWIQNNIEYFGGDPGSVTLFGESVGGTSVNYLLLTQSAQGLFHRAIIESGSVLLPQTFRYNPIDSAIAVASTLGYNTSDPIELLKIFKNASADDIVKASHRDLTDNALAPYLFRPCVETAVTSSKPLITEKPFNLLKNDGLNISVIIGFNNKEGIYWATNYVPITPVKVKEKLKDIIPENLVFENEADKTALMNKIEEIYFKNSTAQDGLIDYFTDYIIRYPITITSESLCKQPNRSVYNYYFTYDSIRNLNKLRARLRLVPGANHGDEMFYMFDPIIYSLLPSTPQTRAMINAMSKFWTSFAKTGKPSYLNITWTPCEDRLNFIELGENIHMTTLPNEDRMKFWRETYAKYNRK